MDILNFLTRWTIACGCLLALIALTAVTGSIPYEWGRTAIEALTGFYLFGVMVGALLWSVLGSV